MTEDEKYVREIWVEVLDDSGWIRIRNGACFTGSRERRWSAAAEFTRTRLEQIRDLEEEETAIAFILAEDVIPEEEAAIYKRILAREQAALADLKRGLRVAE